ncbi:MAG: reductive dehalogenase [Saprospiraceae bacterium]
MSDHLKSYLERAFNIQNNFERFNPKNDIFNRAMWDKNVNPKDFFKSYDIANYKPKRSKGFDHWDFALRNASWHMTDVVGEMKYEKEGRVEGFTDYYSINRKGPDKKVKLTSFEDTTKRVKKAALALGAGNIGICELDKKWIYTHQYSRKTGESRHMDLPKSLKYAIILVVPMDYQLGRTFPAAVSGTATGEGYAQCINVANSLAQFITNLGYEAVASLNDTGMNIPMAIEAGLGEYGRLGLLITPDYGPNVRIAKVFTDLPLLIDQPLLFGVKEFCGICKKCADGCPVKAIPSDEPQSIPPNFSSLKGITKWTVNAEKCFKFWVGMNTDCAICIRVCPYNKDYSKWWNRLGIKIASGPFRKFMLWLHSVLKYGERVKPDQWWSS